MGKDNGESVLRNSTHFLKKKKIMRSFLQHMANYWELYLMLLPGFLCLFIFTYVPMYGITLAFKDYKPSLGILNSPWCEDLFENFKYVFSGYGFWKLVRNTLGLGVLNLIFAFPSSIILALQMNELRNKSFKKAIQTVSYIPYFISWIVISGISYSFLSQDYGIVNSFLVKLGIIDSNNMIG
jgi:putative aldouronate transport system permease protein